MIDLHETLSEFSYGYGLTREVENALRAMGLAATPFQPSLLQEGQIGFDAAFSKPGAAIFLQFKLGFSLQRFVRRDLSLPRPHLNIPFWRFHVDTAETDGQFDLLIKAEDAEAEVYYCAPKFNLWDEYVRHFESGTVFDNSLILRPSAIRQELISKGEPDGRHRIVYDRFRSYVCSEASLLLDEDPEELIRSLGERVRSRKRSLGLSLRGAYDALSSTRQVRQANPEWRDSDGLRDGVIGQRTLDFARAERLLANRTRRVESLRSRSKSEDDAVAAALGLEMWGVGAQMILVTEN